MGEVKKSTFHFKWIIAAFSALLLCSQKEVLAQGSFPTETQLIFDSTSPGIRINDVYSPKLVYQTINNQRTLVMYFGGWYQTNGSVLPNDAIYRAVCISPNSCGTPQKVIDPVASGLGSAGLLNNPSLVELHLNGQDYFVMYMTGVSSNTPGQGMTTSSNEIYYSTSFANDGVNWSKPALLIQNAWLPAATLNSQGHILLYVNTNGSDSTLPFQFVYDLGTNGITYVNAKTVTNPGDVAYINSFVQYRSSSNIYQIVSEHLSNPQVDYLSSVDGLSWTIQNLNIVPVAATEAGRLTPSTHPDTSCWIYYGKNINGVSQHSNIYMKSWC